MEMGINLSDLLNSKIFYCPLSFNMWPTTSTDNNKKLSHYNGKIFEIHTNYDSIFN